MPSNRKPTDKPISPGTLAPARKGWSRVGVYATLSVGCFMSFLVLLGLMLWKANTLAALGLIGNFYYIVLVPLGLCVAGILFGAMRSVGAYRGQHSGGKLELRGPIVGFALTVVGGFLLPAPKPDTFPLSVYVHGEAGPQDIVLRNSGHVLLDLGPDRRREAIGDRGQAYFPVVPASFRGQVVQVSLDSQTHEPVDPGQKSRLDGSTLYLPVRKKPGRLWGRVQDEDGRPLAGVSISVAGLSAKTDPDGHFEVVIPGNRLKPELVLQAVAQKFAPYHSIVVPNGNELTLIMKHEP